MPSISVIFSKEATVKRTTIAFVFAALLTPVTADADFRKVDLSIFGMD